MASKHMFDLAVIGAGSGGVRAARIAGSHGAKVALIETSMHHGPPDYTAIGGTCVNVGCVPKKLFVYGSHFSEGFEDARGYGWSEVKPTHDWKTLLANKNKEIDRLNGIYGKMLGNAGVEIIVGTGSLKDKNTVLVTNGADKKEITAKTILICVGGWPFKPQLPGIEHTISSNECFYLEERPKKMLIVGGGYIAVEFAAIFHGYGTDVHQWYRGPLFLRGFDDDCRRHLKTEMENAKINLSFNKNPASFEKLANGNLKVTAEDGSCEEFDCVMYATGRVPKIEGLGLEKVGIKTGKNGAILVNEESKTNIDNIYAVGDVTDRIQLTPVALAEGHCFADTVFGNNRRLVDHSNVPSAVFSNPEIGTVGLTEAQAVEKYKNVVAFTSTFRPMMHTMTGKQTKTYLKVLVHKDSDKVVGVHMCGPAAADIIQGIGIAVKMGATKKDFDNCIGVHPSTAEEFVTLRSPSYEYKDGAKL